MHHYKKPPSIGSLKGLKQLRKLFPWKIHATHYSVIGSEKEAARTVLGSGSWKSWGQHSSGKATNLATFARRPRLN
jgi:hypothetical protein